MEPGEQAIDNLQAVFWCDDQFCQAARGDGQASLIDRTFQGSQSSRPDRDHPVLLLSGALDGGNRFVRDLQAL